MAKLSGFHVKTGLHISYQLYSAEMQSCRVFPVVILCISTVEHLYVDCFLAVLLYKGDGGRDFLIRNCYTNSQGIPILISSQALSMCMWKEFSSIASRNAVKPMLKMYKFRKHVLEVHILQGRSFADRIPLVSSSYGIQNLAIKASRKSFRINAGSIRPYVSKSTA